MMMMIIIIISSSSSSSSSSNSSSSTISIINSITIITIIFVITQNFHFGSLLTVRPQMTLDNTRQKIEFLASNSSLHGGPDCIQWMHNANGQGQRNASCTFNTASF